MTKVVLIRHARSSANAEGVLAGRLPGISLNETGRAQAASLAKLFEGRSIAAAYTSPIQRCRQTAGLAGFPEATVVADLTECDYGELTGTRLADLETKDLWREIQTRPSTVRFPGGEGMQHMFDRVRGAIAELVSRHALSETIAVFSHGDPIKAILADALGMALDDFQRLHVPPAGISVVDYRADLPMVTCINGGLEGESLLGLDGRPVLGGGDLPTSLVGLHRLNTC